MPNSHISVLMPTYNQRAFISRALDSLLAQTYDSWELIIVDDGSTDRTANAVRPYLADSRIAYHRSPHNRGVGAALNNALRLAQAPFIAYLPSDDVYYADHLASLLRALAERPDALLAYSGVRHHYNRFAEGRIDGLPFQLVQVMHRKRDVWWTEREELVTDDLDRMYWTKLGDVTSFLCTGEVTCEWVDHPEQLHKVLQEPEGGINTYRSTYHVTHPLRFHSTVGNAIDEVEQYRRFRDPPDTPQSPNGLKIVLVGELAYNAERVLALEERGHKLYGLWMSDPYWYNTVGPVPFGHVEDIPREGWKEALLRIKPDIMYGLLNWQAVPFVHHVLRENPGIPFVWHFKEGPFIALEKGMWKELLDLYRCADGVIYCTEEMRDWFQTVAPELGHGQRSLVLDGDLPKADWLEAGRAPRLSAQDGEIHTVVAGRPIGLHAHTVGELADAGIHLHFYGDFTQGQWRAWIDRARGFTPDHLHLHETVHQDRWVTEFSQYDAGWLHFFKSRNGGDIRRSDWDDLNLPARMATYVVAGLPLLQADNSGSRVAIQSIGRQLDISVSFNEMAELPELLGDTARLEEIRSNVWTHRSEFAFDTHVGRLTDFFRSVIDATRREV